MKLAGAMIDMDGTVVCTEDISIAAHDLFLRERLGIELHPHENEELRGLAIIDVMRGVSRMRRVELDVEDLTRRFYVDYNAVMRRTDPASIVYPDTNRFLARLAGVRKPTALVTASTREQMEIILGHLGPGADVFRVRVAYEDAIPTKPDPLPYLTAAQLLGLPPEELLVVEDSVPGVIAAVKARCRVVGVHSKEDLVRFGAMQQVDALDEVPIERLLAA